MKKSVILLIVMVLLIFPLVQAQTYSGFNRFTDDVKLFFSPDKVNLALEIREKEVDSAIENFQNKNTEATIKNLEEAHKKLQVVQKKVSLETSEEIKTSVGKIIDKINKEENLPDEFDDYLLEEEKTQLTAELTEKTFEYCSELAKEDFALMLKEEECNPDTAPPGLEKDLEKLKDIQLRMFVQLMLEIRSCIDDPGTCNCEANVDVKQKAKCEKMVALAIKCEYKEDETSCAELESMKPEPGDSFARSFVPDFLMNLFAEKHEMIEYGLEHSDGVPPECQNENDKPECEKYAHLKENNLDWDEYGNYRPILTPGKHPSTGGTDEPMPTIQEAFPECFDEKGMYLEECGEINVVWAEDGSVNYIIEKDIDGIIDDFENKLSQHTIDAGGYAPGTTADGGDNVIDEGAQGIKKGMNQIQNQIRDIIIVQNVVKTDDLDTDDLDKRDLTPKTPIPTDGSICCKKTMSGKTQYRWDMEEDCLNPATIKGEVVDNDVCVTFGVATDDEDDDVFNPGVPEGPGDGQDVVTGDGGDNVVAGDNDISDSGIVDSGDDSGDGTGVDGGGIVVAMMLQEYKVIENFVENFGL